VAVARGLGTIDRLGPFVCVIGTNQIAENQTTGSRAAMKTTIRIVCACMVTVLAGCADYSEPRRTASIQHSASAPKSTMNTAEQAQKSIAEQCAKRHVDRQNGIFEETMEEKRMKDRICGPHLQGS